MLEINGEVCFRRCPQTFFRVSREKSTVVITIFCIFCFEAVARGLCKISIGNLLKCAVVSRTNSKNNLSEIHISSASRPTPQDAQSFPLFYLGKNRTPLPYTRLTGAPNDGFFLNALKSLFSLFQCTFGYLEMHSNRRCKICFCFRHTSHGSLTLFEITRVRRLLNKSLRRGKLFRLTLSI